MKKVIIIIDGYSTGSDLISAFLNISQEYSYIHIITPTMQYYCKQVNKPCPTHDTQYIKEILYENNLEDLISQLAEFKIKAVVAGAEGDGVILRERLSDYYNLKVNDISKIAARRDKAAMHTLLSQKNITVPQQVVIDRNTDINSVLNQIKNFPMVLKPLNSGGSDGFMLCNNVSELRKNIATALNSNNIFGEKNTQYLLQQYITGKEYAVNTISNNGKHLITDVWTYKQRLSASGHRICDSCGLTQLYPKALEAFTFQCLDTLGIKYGVAHTEVIWSNDGPVFIEAASRLMGGMPTTLLKEALKITQLDALTQLVINGTLPNTSDLGANKIIRIVNVINEHKEGILHFNNFINALRELKCVKDYKFNFIDGDIVPQTTYIGNCIGAIVLMASDEKKLDTAEKELHTKVNALIKIEREENV